MKQKSRIKLYQIKLIGPNFKFDRTIIRFKSYSKVCRCSSQVYLFYYCCVIILFFQTLFILNILFITIQSQLFFFQTFGTCPVKSYSTKSLEEQSPVGLYSLNLTKLLRPLRKTGEQRRKRQKKVKQKLSRKQQRKLRRNSLETLDAVFDKFTLHKEDSTGEL